MLYYTSKNKTGEIEATYSGRFAFIHFKKQQEYEAVNALRKENDFKNLWSMGHDSDSCTAARILAHEYTHKNIFSFSKTGLMLNGYRFWIRARFLFTGATQCVEDYYRMRTIYLMETRPYHEELAKAIDTELESSNNSIAKAFDRAVRHRYQDTIPAAERCINQKWTDLALQPGRIQSVFFGLFGKWLQKNFAVRLSYRNEKGEWEHGSFADQGITNDIYTVRTAETWPAKAQKYVLLKLLVRPLARLENFENQFNWYWIGQRSQFQTLQQLYQIDYPRFWKEILCPNALFIMEWAGIPLPLRDTLLEFTEDTLLMDKPTFISRWKPQLKQWEDDPDIRRYISFFHMHGN